MSFLILHCELILFTIVFTFCRVEADILSGAKSSSDEHQEGHSHDHNHEHAHGHNHAHEHEGECKEDHVHTSECGMFSQPP